MLAELNENDFINSFLSSESRKNQFSILALQELYKYYTKIEKETGEDSILDLIAICCDWCEYHSTEELEKNYCKKINEIEEETLVLKVTDWQGKIAGYVVQNY